MIEPVELGNIFVAALSGALVVVAGALYALFFAFSRVYAKPVLMYLAYGSYLLLFLAVMALAEALNLSGLWRSLVVLLLVGYLLAPHAIWQLCVGTHVGEEGSPRESAAR